MRRGDATTLGPLLALAATLASCGAAVAHPLDADVFAAVRAGDAARVEALLRAGADPNAVEHDGRTPLHAASESGRVVVARLLLAHGADRDASDEAGWSSLEVAASAGHGGVVHVLLESGASLGSGAGSALARAAEAGHLELAARLAPLFNANDHRQALVGAIDGGHAGIVRLLSSTGEPCGRGDEITTLGRAVRLRQREVAKAFLDVGCDPNPADDSYLPFTDEPEALALAETLLRAGALPDRRYRDTWSPVLRAIQVGARDMASLLRRNDGSLVQVTRTGDTALHAAAASGDLDVIAELLSDGRDPNPLRLPGLTPLDIATWSGCDEAAEVLRRHGAVRAMAGSRLDLDALLFDAGWDPLLEHEWTCQRRERAPSGRADLRTREGRSSRIAQLLWERRIPELGALLALPEYLDAARTDRYILHRALHGDTDEALDLLLAAGVRLTDSPTVLHHVARSGDVRRVARFLAAGVDPDLRDDARATPLHFAAREGHAGIVAMLLEAGADPEARDAEGSSPIHAAAASGDVGIVLALLEAGAAPAAETDSCLTPLHLAAAFGSDEVVAMLGGLGLSPHAECVRGAQALRSADTHRKVDWPTCPMGEIPTFENDCVTPLHVAALTGEVDTARALLELGADPDAASADGVTPLHVAARWSRSGVARVLLAQGADHNARAHAHDGATPLDVAHWRGASGVEHALLARGAVPSGQGRWRAMEAHRRRVLR